QAAAARRRYGLRGSADAELAGRREADCTAHPRLRQVQARGWDLLARGLPLRRDHRYLYLPCWEEANDDGPHQSRRCDLLSQQLGGLAQGPAKPRVLSKNPPARGPAQPL